MEKKKTEKAKEEAAAIATKENEKTTLTAGKDRNMFSELCERINSIEPKVEDILR